MTGPPVFTRTHTPGVCHTADVSDALPLGLGLERVTCSVCIGHLF